MSYFRAKCTKFGFVCSSAPDPGTEAYSASSDLRGLHLRGREGKIEGRGKKEGGKEGK